MSVLFLPSSQITIYFEMNACLINARKLFKCIENNMSMLIETLNRWLEISYIFLD